jgi:hypothetical protein
MNELEKAQVQRQLLLRETPMRTQPRSEQRPEAFHGVDMNFAKPLPMVIAGLFASTVTHAFLLVAPLLQAAVDIVLLRIDLVPGIIVASIRGLLVLC